MNALTEIAKALTGIDPAAAAQAGKWGEYDRLRELRAGHCVRYEHWPSDGEITADEGLYDLDKTVEWLAEAQDDGRTCMVLFVWFEGDVAKVKDITATIGRVLAERYESNWPIPPERWLHPLGREHSDYWEKCSDEAA